MRMPLALYKNKRSLQLLLYKEGMCLCARGVGVVEGRAPGAPLSAGDQSGEDMEEKRGEARSAQSKGCSGAGNRLPAPVLSLVCL